MVRQYVNIVSMSIWYNGFRIGFYLLPCPLPQTHAHRLIIARGQYMYKIGPTWMIEFWSKYSSINCHTHAFLASLTHRFSCKGQFWTDDQCRLHQQPWIGEETPGWTTASTAQASSATWTFVFWSLASTFFCQESRSAGLHSLFRFAESMEASTLSPTFWGHWHLSKVSQSKTQGSSSASFLLW